MDFLTQPLVSASRSPQTQASPLPATATTAAPSHTSEKHTEADRSSLSPSFATSSTSDQTALDQTAARFASLRTADTAVSPANGIPGEPVIEPPSTGDWRTFGRVKAQVVLWPDGTVGTKGAKKLRECDDGDEWVVEGTLWITKRDEIILVLNRDKHPRHVDRSKIRAAPLGRRLSIGSLGRTSSRESGGDSSATHAGTTGEEQGEHTGAVMGFVKKVISAVTPGKLSQSETGTSGEGLSLARTRTGERSGQAAGGQPAPSATTEEPQRRQSIEGGAAGDGGHGGLTFEEPEKAPSPFPTYKGHPVTALYIGSPGSIHAVRFYPHRLIERADSASFAVGGKDSPVSSAPGPAAPKAEEKPPGSDKVLLVHAPVVELDIVDKGKVGGIAGEEGRKREVTVGFVFKDVLLTNEADTFRQRVEALFHSTASTTDTTQSGGGGFGSALMRTFSGGRSSSAAEPGAGGHTGEPVLGDVEGETGETVPPPPGMPNRRRSSFFKNVQTGDVWV